MRRPDPGRSVLVSRGSLVGVALAFFAFPLPAHAEAEAPDEPTQVNIASAPPLPPLETNYLQYGVALTGEFVASPGAMCETGKPCVLGSGGGVGARVGWRSAGPWYFGGAYELTKQDSGNLYRLATLQQLRFETRYYFSTGRITQPFAAAGVGVAGYGNEWSIETQGPSLSIAAGAETQLSRTNVVGLSLTYRIMYFTPFTVPSLSAREGSLAHMFALDVALDLLDPR